MGGGECKGGKCINTLRTVIVPKHGQAVDPQAFWRVLFAGLHVVFPIGYLERRIQGLLE